MSSKRLDLRTNPRDYRLGVKDLMTNYFLLTQELLTPANYDALIGLLTSEVTTQLEKAVLKSVFNRVSLANILN